jgi:formylglycine-generating enzyme required for sulfatase activity
MQIKLLFTTILFCFFIQVFAKDKPVEPRQLREQFVRIDPESYRLAIEDLLQTYPEEFKNMDKYFQAIDQYENKSNQLIAGIDSNDKRAIKEASSLLRTLDEGLLNNPLLDFDELILLRRFLGQKARKATGGGLGVVPANFNNNSAIKNPAKGWNNDIVLLSDLRNKKNTKILFKPEENKIINDLDLHFNGDELMFSSIGTNNRWHLFSLDRKTGLINQLTPSDITDFDCFDGCFLPNGKINFCSTATFLGLPCINGRPRMCGLYQMDPETKKIRQITFDQDSNWEPVVMNDGKVFYQRWEYSGLPHSNSRIMFIMNPDGTSQKAFYGSNSYFPTAFFGARPIPGRSSAIVGIASGHHSVSHNGRLMIIDAQKGRKEAEGVVTEIPRRGKKVEPIIRDRLPDGIWPLFMNPYPLSDKYILVSMKASKDALWGLYLVDVFNNMTLLYENEGEAVIEAVPARKRPTPHVLPDRIDPDSKTATVYIQDIYHGPGLKGIPKGEVKQLRIGSYYFSPYGQGGLLGTIGMDGPWDINRIIGTVPVEEDGSAMFTIPANTPIFLQPLDKEGMALQQMRSWFTGMPGERVSCVGCHEDQNELALPKMTLAAKKKPSSITPWQGEERGFSFRHEVQPLLDRNCVACHDGSDKNIPYLKGDKMITDWDSQIGGKANPSYGGHFSQSYAHLHRFVRRAGIESDMDILTPMDFHESQTELIQILKKGHHNVQLKQDEWEKLYCWIALNAQYHGQRTDIPNFCDAEKSVKRMKENAIKYANKYIDFDNLPGTIETPESQYPQPYPSLPDDDQKPEGWPFKKSDAINKQLAMGHIQFSIPLGKGLNLEMTKIPAGSFLMGSKKEDNEQPMTATHLDKAFWMGKFEITNEQYALFDSLHDSRTEHRHGYQFGRAGYPMNASTQPVVRISWTEAMAYCEWLSEKTGYKFILPTEAQWEWACRAGSDQEYWFGKEGVDYSNYANMGDKKLAEFAACTAHKFYESARIIENPNQYDDWIPRDTLYNDGGFVSDHVGRYRQNPWELYDMHGNVWEWTRSDYKSYPYRSDDGRNSMNTDKPKVVRGGSWYARPHRNTSSYRIPYRSYQKVFDVGFRVIIEE